jgi:hypothetical protein
MREFRSYLHRVNFLGFLMKAARARPRAAELVVLAYETVLVRIPW